MATDVGPDIVAAGIPVALDIEAAHIAPDTVAAGIPVASDIEAAHIAPDTVPTNIGLDVVASGTEGIESNVLWPPSVTHVQQFTMTVFATVLL